MYYISIISFFFDWKSVKNSLDFLRFFLVEIWQFIKPSILQHFFFILKYRAHIYKKMPPSRAMATTMSEVIYLLFSLFFLRFFFHFCCFFFVYGSKWKCEFEIFLRESNKKKREIHFFPFLFLWVCELKSNEDNQEKKKTNWNKRQRDRYKKRHWKFLMSDLID